MDSGDESDATTTGDSKPSASTSTPSKSAAAPTFTSIGSPQVATHSELQRGGSGLRSKAPATKSTDDASEQEQLSKTPEGDQASGAVKVEGLMDTSENPLKM
jgi:protein phosphatase 2C family protein 2/3